MYFAIDPYTGLEEVDVNALAAQSGNIDPGVAGALIAAGAAIVAILAVFVIAMYIYMSLAYSAIGRKAKLASPGLAWIPIVGPAIIVYQASGMHWWPWLLLIGAIIPVIGGLFSLAFAVFYIIWHWKMFEKIGKEGWWALLMLIPIVNIIIIGIAAWSKK